MSWRRAMYTALALLVSPLLRLRLRSRARREPGYGENVGERFGHYDPGPTVDIWIHAVSVGETRAAAPLVRALREKLPGCTILMTHMTATGRETGREIFGEAVCQAYLPYDLPNAVRRFVRRYRPRLGLLMETELWPNLVAIARSEGIPLYLINARLSARSARGYARLSGLARETLGQLAAIGAQTILDAQRLAALGGSAIRVTGNLKFDILVPSDMPALGAHLRGLFDKRRPVWLAASTRESEEALLLDSIVGLPAEVLTVIVPRHPQRFLDVAELLRSRGISFQRRSDEQPIGETTRVVLGDSMGEMFAYYLAVDVAYIGGSLVAMGGQNLLEACAVGTPALIGPYTFNFEEVSQLAIAAGAALRVYDATELIEQVGIILADRQRREQMSQAGRDFYRFHQGATLRTLELLAPALKSMTDSAISRKSAGD